MRTFSMILGHSEISTTMRYLHLLTEDLQRPASELVDPQPHTVIVDNSRSVEDTTNARIRRRVENIRGLAEVGAQEAAYQAASLAMAVLHDTVGGAHPLTAELRGALEGKTYARVVGAARAVVDLFDEGGLQSPRLAIAHEIEGSILDIADAQVRAAEQNNDEPRRLLQLGIAAFLAGAALEDVLRRLCDANGIAYDAQRTTISRLQSVLYQPSNQIEVISNSENKQITAWGDTRNKADHGRFSDLTHSEVLTMVIGVRGFIDRHLP